MLNSQYSIQNLIATIYECQKKIIFNRRVIKEIELFGNADDISTLIKEIESLQKKIEDLRRELSDKYQR